MKVDHIEFVCHNLFMKTIFYTGKGDKGASAMGKKKIPKDNSLFHVLGTLDEVNSWVGFARTEALKNKKKYAWVVATLLEVQESLFVAQAQVAAIGMGWKPKIRITEKHIEEAHARIANVDERVPQLKNFVIPGGSELSSRIDIARTISRRLERMAVAFSKKKKVRPELLQYLNRLSSVLFALARFVEFVQKIKYQHPRYQY